MKKTLLMTAAATMFAMPAMAEMHEDKHGDKHEKKMEAKVQYYFDQMDENGDGTVTAEEHTMFADDMFEQTDADTDGNITMEELKEAKKQEWKEMKEELGSNKFDIIRSN